MKKQLAALGLVGGVLLSSVGIGTVSASGVHYKDVNTKDNFYNSVEYLLEKEAISGTLPTFRPYENITRGQFSSIYAKANNYKVKLTLDRFPNPIFKDVPKNHQFYPYVQAMYPHVMTGYKKNSYDNTRYFGINDNLTRGQLAGILTSSYGLITPESYSEHGGTVSDIFDGERFIGQWGQHIATLETMGIMSGYADGNMYPNKPINRSQFANMLYKSLEGYERVVDYNLADDFGGSNLKKLGLSRDAILEKVKSLKDNDVMNYVDSYVNYWDGYEVSGYREFFILDIRKEGEILFEDINVKMIVTKDKYGYRKFVIEKIEPVPVGTPESTTEDTAIVE